MNWQTPLALLVVVLTLVVLIRASFFKKKSGSCGGHCGCGKESPSDDLKPHFASSQKDKRQKSPLS